MLPPSTAQSAHQRLFPYRFYPPHQGLVLQIDWLIRQIVTSFHACSWKTAFPWRWETARLWRHTHTLASARNHIVSEFPFQHCSRQLCCPGSRQSLLDPFSYSSSIILTFGFIINEHTLFGSITPPLINNVDAFLFAESLKSCSNTLSNCLFYSTSLSSFVSYL